MGRCGAAGKLVGCEKDATIHMMYANIAPRDAVSDSLISCLDEIESSVRGRCHIRVHVATPETFLTAPLHCSWLHLCGHSHGNGFVVEDDKEGHRPAQVPWKPFIDACSRGQLQFLFLNACDTDAVGSAVAEACDATVICHRGPRRADVCRQFPIWFYDALGEGVSVRAAFQTTSSRLESTFGSGVGKPFLLLPHSMPHTIKLRKDAPCLSRNQWNVSLSPLSRVFVIDPPLFCKIVQLVRQNRLVILHKGSGKTTLLRDLVHFLAAPGRPFWSRAVIKGVSSVEGIRTKLSAALCTNSSLPFLLAIDDVEISFTSPDYQTILKNLLDEFPALHLLVTLKGDSVISLKDVCTACVELTPLSLEASVQLFLCSACRYLTMGDFSRDVGDAIMTDEIDTRSRLANHEVIKSLKGDPKLICKFGRMLLPGSWSLLERAYWSQRLFIASRPPTLQEKVLAVVFNRLSLVMSWIISSSLDSVQRSIPYELALAIGICCVKLFFWLPFGR